MILLSRVKLSLTVYSDCAILYAIEKTIEVALFISNLSDAAAADEDRGKGTAPKEVECCAQQTWAYGKYLYDCHFQNEVGRYQNLVINLFL